MADTRKEPWPGTAGTSPSPQQAQRQQDKARPAAQAKAKEPPSRGELVRDLCQRKMVPTLTQLLPKGADVARFARVFLTVVESDPVKLMQCSDGSLARALMHSAEVGLQVGGAYPHAYLIPYWNKNRKPNPGYEAQFQISVWGYIELIRRSGTVRKVWGDVVYSNDECELVSGTDGKQIKHKPSWFTPKADRGHVVGAYACATLENGETVFEPISKEELDQARAQNQGQTPAWELWYDQQAIKCALKRLQKYLAKGSIPERLLEIDQDPGTGPVTMDTHGEPIEMPDELAGAVVDATGTTQSALDQAVAQAQQARATGASGPSSAPPAMTVDRGRLHSLLIDMDERWRDLGERVRGWDELQALTAATYIDTIRKDAPSGTPPEMPHHIRLDRMPGEDG